MPAKKGPYIARHDNAELRPETNETGEGVWIQVYQDLDQRAQDRGPWIFVGRVAAIRIAKLYNFRLKDFETGA